MVRYTVQDVLLRCEQGASESVTGSADYQGQTRSMQWTSASRESALAHVKCEVDVKPDSVGS